MLTKLEVLFFLTSLPLSCTHFDYYSCPDYLRNIKQENGSVLPDGPVFLYPESLMRALRREVRL